MIVGKVIGSLISTRKTDSLIGSKFMVVEPLAALHPDRDCFVATDTIGAGVGEIVLVATGSAARTGMGMERTPIDAAIVGIVDSECDVESIRSR